MDPYLRSFLDTARGLLRPWSLGEPEELPRQAQLVEQKFNVEPKAPEPVQLSRLHREIQGVYAEKGVKYIYELSPRHKRWLPWVMYHGGSPQPIEWRGFLSAALDELRSSLRWSRLGGWIHVYLKYYDAEKRHTEELRKFIHDALVRYDGKQSRLKRWKSRITLLFAPRPLIQTANWMLTRKQPVSECLQTLGFEGDLATCQFLDALTSGMIVYGERNFPRKLDRVLDLLEIPGDHGTQPRSMDLMRMAASRFLPKAGTQIDADIQNPLQSLFLRHLGDPRFPGGVTRWKGVPREAITIFGQWLSQQDIEFFFNIVDRSAQDDAWEYRRAFWAAYIPYIEMTWVVLGSHARYMLSTPQMRAQMKDRGYGQLRGAGARQSVFLIRIKGYDFIEWSHSGACRVWRQEESPFDFGRHFYDAFAFRDDTYEDRFTHHSSASYRWQGNLAGWIQRHNGIRPAQSYRLSYRSRADGMETASAGSMAKESVVDLQSDETAEKEAASAVLTLEKILDLPDDETIEEETEKAPAIRADVRSMTVDLPGVATMEMVWIEPGTFTMGSSETKVSSKSREAPQHKVAISQGFWLGKYAITQGQWRSVMGTRPWVGKRYVRDDSDHPAVWISWKDVQEFIERLNEAEGSEMYRLPMEAEWEYACRTGTTTRWAFGDDKGQVGGYAWYRDNAWGAGEQYAHAVGTKLPNAWGLHDMHGNVWEWVQDWYGLYTEDAQVDPTGPSSGSTRVQRGGSFHDSPRDVRSATRYKSVPVHRSHNVGARLVRHDP